MNSVQILMRSAIAVILLSATVGVAGEVDPYEPLQLYDGKWVVQVSTPEQKTDHLKNRCARTGTFFVCEQEVNGKAAALVVFLPIGTAAGGGQEYRNIGLGADASKPGDWGKLVIDGDTWTYSWTQNRDEKTVPWRNVNHFTGKDRIHFELQRMEDGKNWKTTMAGDEQREK